MVLNAVGTVNSGAHEVVHHLRALADVMFHQLRLPAKPEGDFGDGPAIGMEGHGRCGTVGMCDNGGPVEPVVVVWVRVRDVH